MRMKKATLVQMVFLIYGAACGGAPPGPTLPPGVPASNWIPTPSTTYYSTLYPRTQVSTAFQLTLRMYYPTPGTQPPSILPCTEACQPQLKESYIPPSVKRVP